MSSMHYVFLLLGLVAVSLRHVQGFTDLEISAVTTGFRPFVAECGKEFGVTEEVIKAAKQSGNIGSLDPCLFDCFGKRMGLIDENGKFAVEKSTQLIKEFVTNEKKQKKALEFVEKCSSVNDHPVSDENSCERAVLLYKCYAPFKTQFTPAQ